MEEEYVKILLPHFTFILPFLGMASMLILWKVIQAIFDVFIPG